MSKKTQDNSSGVIEKTKKQLADKLPESNFIVWIKPLKWSVKKDRLYLIAPDKFFAAHVKSHFLNEIKECVGLDVVIGIDEKNFFLPKASISQGVPQALPGMRPCLLRLNPSNTFDSFIVDESNKLAHIICRGIAEKEENGISGNVFLTGPSGCGKTHLLQATARRLAESEQVICVTADQFGKDFVSAVRSKKAGAIQAFENKYTTCSALFLDDLQEIAGRTKTVITLSSAVTALIDKGKLVVSTSPLKRVELEKVLDKKLVRLLAGLILTVKKPTDEINIGITANMAKKMGIEMVDDQAEFLMRLLNDPAKIKVALNGLKARILLSDSTTPTAEMLKEVVEEQVDGNISAELSLQVIAEVVSKEHAISLEDMRSRSRYKKHTLPRNVAMFLARELTELSLEKIGDYFDRDHSTVLNSCKNISEACARDTSFKGQLEIIRSKLKLYHSNK